MSYPAIAAILERRGLSIETSSESELKGALWEALNTNLTDGIAYLKSVATEVKTTGKRILKVEDPNSPLGRQLIRLVGADVSRKACESEFGIALGFYNCCNVVAAPTKEELAINVREQIALQNGVLASADC